MAIVHLEREEVLVVKLPSLYHLSQQRVFEKKVLMYLSQNALVVDLLECLIGKWCFLRFEILRGVLGQTVQPSISLLYLA
jgi:hypothetical protein